MDRPVILNSAGKPILLNARETLIANSIQKQVNALGFEIDITTLTTIMKKITEQKFFHIAPADYLPLRVGGEGAWSTQLTTYRSFETADDFMTGVISTGGNNGRLASADAAVDAIPVKVTNWAKSIGWTLMDLEQAAKAGNWDLVTAKEKSRKKNWDLGIQKIAFLGGGQSDILGLYNQSGVTNNTALITKKISTMTGTELKAFVAAVVGAYRSNCAHTAWPTHFIVPESDYTGMAAPTSADYPLKSVLEVLMETFKTVTMNPNFKILPCAYGDTANNSLGVTRYVLLNYEEESLRMDIPVDYTSTMANSVDNFSFQNVGYGQFTGVMAYRPLELLYFSF